MPPFEKLFDTDDFPARWHCGRWTDLHGYVHIFSDLAIFGAYAAIPVTLLHLVRRRRTDLPFPPVFWLFACFIFACGAAHLVEATLFWKPWYRFAGLLKVVTAIASWTTVVALARALPSALHLPGLAIINAQLRREIEERREVEGALRRSEERYALAARGTNDGIWDWHVVTGEFLGSDRYWELMGSERFDRFEPLFEAFQRRVHQDDVERVNRALEAHLEAKSGYEVEFRLRRDDGSYRWFHVRGLAMRDENGNPMRMAGFLADITARKTAEAEREGLLEQLRLLNAELEGRVAERTLELSNSLKERELLLQEMHHRVKNNLQVISSLIRMQARQVEHEPSRAALEECQSRVEAIALIHEQLYRASNFASVPFSEYANNLAHAVLRATDTSPSNIQLDVEATAVTLPIDKAIPCGLILNELMTNALKHAFPDQRRGTVKVRLSSGADADVVLSVSDDGVGLGTDFQTRRSASLGVQLVLTLVEQLDGRLEIVQQGGTCFSVRFPAPTRAQVSNGTLDALQERA
jgi:two-component sensor histidine kinase/PAS domain-containing protein